MQLQIQSTLLCAHKLYVCACTCIYRYLCMYMHLQIFGPLLPIIVVDDLDAAIQFINARSVKHAL